MKLKKYSWVLLTQYLWNREAETGLKYAQLFKNEFMDEKKYTDREVDKYMWHAFIAGIIFSLVVDTILHFLETY